MYAAVIKGEKLSFLPEVVSLVPRVSEQEEEMGESLVSTASRSGWVITHEDKI